MFDTHRNWIKIDPLNSEQNKLVFKWEKFTENCNKESFQRENVSLKLHVVSLLQNVSL